MSCIGRLWGLSIVMYDCLFVACLLNWGFVMGGLGGRYSDAIYGHEAGSTCGTWSPVIAAMWARSAAWPARRRSAGEALDKNKVCLLIPISVFLVICSGPAMG